MTKSVSLDSANELLINDNTCAKSHTFSRRQTSTSLVHTICGSCQVPAKQVVNTLITNHVQIQ